MVGPWQVGCGTSTRFPTRVSPSSDARVRAELIAVGGELLIRAIEALSVLQPEWPVVPPHSIPGRPFCLQSGWSQHRNTSFKQLNLKGSLHALRLALKQLRCRFQA